MGTLTYVYDRDGIYDGDGDRVTKTVSSAITLYWPGLGGVLDESDGTGATMGKQVQFAGLLVWYEDMVGVGNFLFQDHLGSTRVTGSAVGALKDDIDYLPFGSVAGNYGVAPSDNHYQFTGYESDASGDSTSYAVFRNESPSMGRFNRPDPYDGSYDLSRVPGAPCLVFETWAKFRMQCFAMAKPL